MEELLNDGMEYFRKSSLEILIALVKKLPHFQKENIVAIIVNKMGDTDNPIVLQVQKFIAIAIKVLCGLS
jgi:hypothetical protein